MEEKETKPLTPPLQDLGECKVVWKEEEKTKVGRGNDSYPSRRGTRTSE